MASGITKTPFKDGIVKPASGSPDLEFEGPAKFAAPEFSLDGSKKMVVQLGSYNDVEFGKDTIK